MVFTALHKIYIIIPVLSVGCVIDPCPSQIPQTTVVDICQSSFASENIEEGGATSGKISIRVDKQTDNCTCHATLVNAKTKFFVYITPYRGLDTSAPNFPNCGLEVQVYTSLGTFHTLSCTSGLAPVSILLENEKPMYLTTRADIDGNFTKGYCIHLVPVHQIDISATLQVSCGSYNFNDIPTTDLAITTAYSNSIEIETSVYTILEDTNRESYARIAIGSAAGGIIFTLAVLLVVFVCKRCLLRFKAETSQPNYQNTVSTVTMNEYNTLHVGSDSLTYTDITNYTTIEDYVNTVEN